MRLEDHAILAENIGDYMNQFSMKEFLLLVMNEEELDYYTEKMRVFLYGNLTRDQQLTPRCRIFCTRNGSRLRIVRYDALDSLMCGWTIDKWWATTDLLPERTRTLLNVCKPWGVTDDS